MSKLSNCCILIIEKGQEILKQGSWGYIESKDGVFKLQYLKKKYFEILQFDKAMDKDYPNI